jgi:hypothetical protein
MSLDLTIPARFLQTAFDDGNLIAIAYRQPLSTAWHHRFVTAAAARAPNFLGWLRFLNSNGHEYSYTDYVGRFCPS